MKYCNMTLILILNNRCRSRWERYTAEMLSKQHSLSNRNSYLSLKTWLQFAKSPLQLSNRCMIVDHQDNTILHAEMPIVTNQEAVNFHRFVNLHSSVTSNHLLTWHHNCQFHLVKIVMPQIKVFQCKILQMSLNLPTLSQFIKIHSWRTTK